MHSAPGVGGTFRIQIFMSGEPPRFIGIIFKPVKWALLALKVSGNVSPRHFGFVIRSPPHSITSSATASSLSGIVRPNMRAVCALIISSNLSACTTGRSSGFPPLRMRPL
jgi:hypothetical protein